jgi:hypothetical protein
MASPFIAAYMVECTTAWPARFAMLRQDGLPDQNLYCRRASAAGRGSYVHPSGRVPDSMITFYPG